MPVAIRTLTREATLVKFQALDKAVQPKALEEVRLYVDGLVESQRAKVQEAREGNNLTTQFVREEIFEKTLAIQQAVKDDAKLVKFLDGEPHYLWFLETGILAHRG